MGRDELARKTRRALARGGRDVFETDAEGARESCLALVGEPDGPAGGRGTADPVQLEQPAGEAGTECAGKVMTLLRPVQAVADQRAPHGAQAGQIDAEVADEGRAAAGEL